MAPQDPNPMHIENEEVKRKEHVLPSSFQEEKEPSHTSNQLTLIDKMAYFLTVVTTKLILVRSSTSYSGASNIRAGMKSYSSMIVEVCLTSPVALISI